MPKNPSRSNLFLELADRLFNFYLFGFDFSTLWSTYNFVHDDELMVELPEKAIFGGSPI